MIFYQPIRLHNIRADLTSPCNVFFITYYRIKLLFALAYLKIVEPGSQNLHRQFSVSDLRALALTRNNNPCRYMAESNSGRYLVDMLAARTRCTKRINLDVLFPDVDGDIILNLGVYKNCAE